MSLWNLPFTVIRFSFRREEVTRLRILINPYSLGLARALVVNRNGFNEGLMGRFKGMFMLLIMASTKIRKNVVITGFNRHTIVMSCSKTVPFEIPVNMAFCVARSIRFIRS